MLELTNIKKQYTQNKSAIKALDGVSFIVPSNSIFSLLGKNGSGKTTTIKAICNLVSVDSGFISVDKESIGTRKYFQKINAVIDTSRSLLPELTVLENLTYCALLNNFSSKEAHTRALELISELDLLEKTKNSVRTLSKGMLTKLNFAVSLINRPSFLMLDEPTLGLDIEAAQIIEQKMLSMAKEGVGILLTTHQIDLAVRISDEINIIGSGKIVQILKDHPFDATLIKNLILRGDSN